MGLFGKLFEKKQCDFCGGEIGLLGNRKLEDGNMCKNCAALLSPWFSERKSSTVAEIQEQLNYREANKEAVQQFNVTRSFGRKMKVLLDEDAAKFIVTDANNFRDVNPDVLDYSQVTGVDLDVRENRSEEMKTDNEGKRVSYNPPRYFYSYDFNMIIRVNHPYFSEIKFKLNPSSVKTNEGHSVVAGRKPDPKDNQDYVEFDEMGYEIKRSLMSARNQSRRDAKKMAAPKVAVTCPYCGASTIPDANGCCEYCGGAVKG